MSYSGLAATQVINRVKKHFEKKPEFEKRGFPPQVFYDVLNEGLDELHQDCYPQPEEFTVTTVVSQAEYPMDQVGTAGHLSDEIGEIVDVEYDGARLAYRYFYPEQITLRVTGDDDGAPDGWYVSVKSGVRYLGLAASGVSIGADEAVAVRVFAYRMPTAIAADSTVLKIERDFVGLLTDIAIFRMYRKLELFDLAFAWWNTGSLDQKKHELRVQTQKRLGRTVDQILILGCQDVFE